MRLCKPFKSATKQSITQGFWDQHQANDFASFYGDFLVSPFNGKIVNIRGVESANDVISGDNSFLEGGCGIKVQSAEDPTITFSYWHTQDAFPVNRGDIVIQGQPIAMMGNTGFVMSGTTIVPIDIRLKPPYPGTHTHITMGKTDSNGTYTVMDYSSTIDWSILINYNAIATIKALIQKIQNFLTGK